ncbi:hypothetical protein L3Q82_012958 [Scortum barcoo]|uniref:Uncharacterized protein n=1 Tax=Scortum barcoo TaxID=214431 RepID=A0ACB8W154_9TELE|nr:hypothetical protein L3Q82_012958 [Scortum barcoo]
MEQQIKVFYPKENITPARGSSVKLSCEAHYDFAKCGLLHVVWIVWEEQNQSAELINPRKYHTTVNETVSEGDMRRRQAVTEILDLNPEDNNRYQCKATCESGGSAMGHFITIKVQG